jgi:hypothetical protein
MIAWKMNDVKLETSYENGIDPGGGAGIEWARIS